MKVLMIDRCNIGFRMIEALTSIVIFDDVYADSAGSTDSSGEEDVANGPNQGVNTTETEMEPDIHSHAISSSSSSSSIHSHAHPRSFHQGFIALDGLLQVHISTSDLDRLEWKQCDERLRKKRDDLERWLAYQDTREIQGDSQSQSQSLIATINSTGIGKGVGADVVKSRKEMIWKLHHSILADTPSRIPPPINIPLSLVLLSPFSNPDLLSKTSGAKTNWFVRQQTDSLIPCDAMTKYSFLLVLKRLSQMENDQISNGGEFQHTIPGCRSMKTLAALLPEAIILEIFLYLYAHTYKEVVLTDLGYHRYK